MQIESKTIYRNRKYLEIIGLYQILGGITGIILILIGNIRILKFSLLAIPVLLLVVGFYLFSIYAGYKIIKEHEKKIIYSEIVQYIQILSIGLLGFVFSLTAGIALYIGFDYTNEFLFRIHFEILSATSEFHILPDQSIIYTYVNIIPIIILIIIDKSVKVIKKAEILETNKN